MEPEEAGRSDLEIAHPIIAEERSVELTSHDIALIVLIRRDIENSPDGLLTISYSSIQALSHRIDLLEARYDSKTERRLSESLTRLMRAECLVQADLIRLHLSKDPEFQLTSLGEAFAEWHMNQSTFSGEPLTAIFSAFIDQLSRIVDEAEQAKNVDDWQIGILPQMQYALRDMLINVQNHQRELDKRHSEIRDFIPELLKEHSEEAIKQCKDRLDNVLDTITDLQETVLGSSSTIASLIGRISELAFPLEMKQFDAVYDGLFRRIQSINNWISQRLTDWTEHYSVVHKMLRTIIRVDRQKRITEALKRAISEPPDWSLVVVEEITLCRMRSDMDKQRKIRSAPKISRELHDRETDFEEIKPDELPGLLRRYAQKDFEAFSEVKISQILKRALPTMNPDVLKSVPHYPDFMAWLVSLGLVDEKDRNWKIVSDEIEIEELKVKANDFS